MANPIRLLYLIGQFPAINHSYLLSEVRILRKLGLDIRAASISAPDRPLEKLSPIEREEAERTYYVKPVPVSKTAFLTALEFLHHPVRCFRGLFFALRLSRGSPVSVAYHLAYFGEAVLVGRYMRRCDITHVHASFSATVALIVTKIFPVTMSFGVYGYGELHNPRETHLAERIHGALFVRSISRHGRGQLMLSCDRTEWPKLVYAPLGIDPSRFSPAAIRTCGSTPQILCVGRLAPEKGQLSLLQALAALSSAGLPLHLTLIGDGPDREFLERSASELGLAASVGFTGWVDQEHLIKPYAETDIFVLPSLAEGIPMVLMEAMAMQIPCVAPRITGIPELIQDGVDGLLYAVADVRDLTDKIRALLESTARRRAIGEAGRLRVLREYDMSRNTELFAAVLFEQLGNPRERD